MAASRKAWKMQVSRTAVGSHTDNQAQRFFDMLDIKVVTSIEM